MAHLIVRDGPLRGQRFEVDSGEVSIGREDTDVIIEDDTEVSRGHAVVRSSDEGIEIEDLGSTNGTFVNERKTSGPTPLSNGDIIRVGQTRLDVEVEEDDPNKTSVSGVVVPPTQEHPAQAPAQPQAGAPPKAETHAARPEPEPQAEAEPEPEPHVDPLPRPQPAPSPPTESDQEMRAPTSELPTRSREDGGAAERPRSNRMPLLIGATVVVAALLAYLLYTALAGGPPSRQDYVASVNGVCEGDMPKLNDLNVNRPKSTERAASLVNGMTGEIEELERPEEGGKAIDAFIGSFNRVGAGFEDLNVSQSANNQERARDAARKLERSVQRFDRAARDLGVNRCAFRR